MHEGVRTGGIIYSARTVGGGAGSHVTAAEQWPPHTFPLRRIEPCTRCRSAALPPAAPGFRLHPLKGNRAGQWSVRVSGNWRVVFRF